MEDEAILYMRQRSERGTKEIIEGFAADGRALPDRGRERDIDRMPLSGIWINIALCSMWKKSGGTSRFGVRVYDKPLV